ncbi:MAG: aminotransferase class I/II-fold pyridoxal phosphate-dependent enzyme [Oscillospiraceae bacterium]|nr:aminotransferase class I/II-fold pyridoxal phosphate-dependent enzyme [Oscillospiraceae bacterium]
MATYREMSKQELEALLCDLQKEYEGYKAKGLKLDLSRGKPDKAQLELSMPMLDVLSAADVLAGEDGTDARNYGVLDGLPEAKKLMAQILELAPEQVFVGGASSLNLMHDCMGLGFLHGYPGGNGGWYKEGKVKFLCPAPGYDRHFSVTEHFGIELVSVPMTGEGPDMAEVERLVADPAVKGIWCVPKYQNPLGLTFSDEVVRAFARLSPAAGDFRIFWDNAYNVHDLYPGEGDQLLNLMDELKATGKEDMVLMFSSTSKITFAGSGISAIGCSAANMAWVKKHFGFQIIGYDKVNMLRHVKFLPDIAAVKSHMVKHAQLLRPKFEAVRNTLEDNLGETGVASWTNPRGGYFVSLDILEGCAVRTIALCKEAGVVMTGAGAPFPYGKDPEDKNIRIAPSFAPLGEVKQAAALLCLCAKIACVEKLLG